MKFYLIIIQFMIVFTRSAKIQTENRDASCSTPECQQQWPAQNNLEIIEMAVRTIVTAHSSQTNDLFAPIKAILEQDLAVRAILSATPIRPNTNTTSSASSSGLSEHNQANAGFERWLMLSLDTMLREINPYALLYKSMCQVFEEE